MRHEFACGLLLVVFLVVVVCGCAADIYFASSGFGVLVYGLLILVNSVADKLQTLYILWFLCLRLTLVMILWFAVSLVGWVCYCLDCIVIC